MKVEGTAWKSLLYVLETISVREVSGDDYSDDKFWFLSPELTKKSPHHLVFSVLSEKVIDFILVLHQSLFPMRKSYLMRLLCPSGTMNIEKGALGDSGANSVSLNKLDSLLTCRLSLHFRINHQKLTYLRARISLDRFLKSVLRAEAHFQIRVFPKITSLSLYWVFLRWESKQYLRHHYKNWNSYELSSTQELSSKPSRI